MPVVEPVVDEDKIRQLLDEGTESGHLDFEEYLDLGQTRDRVELVKDAGAMLAEGGYVVVGADDNGKPTGLLTASEVALFDEARLRSILRKWLPEPFVMLSRAHVIGGNHLALVYLAPHQDGVCIFSVDGQYNDGGKTKSVFRQGDVFVRHGSSSERWTQRDVETFRRSITEQQRGRWLEQIQPLIERIQRGEQARDLTRATPSALDYNLDTAIFDEIVEQLLRDRDQIPIRSYFLRARRETQSLLTRDTADFDAFVRLQTRTAAIAAAGVAYSRPEVIREGVRALAEAYTAVGETLARRSDVLAARAWMEIIALVESLGAFAVRLEDWPTVRSLVLQPVTYPHYDAYWRAWLRHGLTMASRSGLLEASAEDDRFGPGLIARAHGVAAQVPALHMDVSSESDKLLNSICQFDFLASAIAVLAFESDHGRDYYPSFNRYSSQRTAQIAGRLIADAEMRGQILGDVSDTSLAAALNLIDRQAANEGMRFSGWHGFSADVERWIAATDFTPLNDR